MYSNTLEYDITINLLNRTLLNCPEMVGVVGIVDNPQELSIGKSKMVNPCQEQLDFVRKWTGRWLDFLYLQLHLGYYLRIKILLTFLPTYMKVDTIYLLVVTYSTMW